MNIIVAGCGKVGSTIISNLVKEGHNVIAVDQSAATIDEMSATVILDDYLRFRREKGEN